MFLAGPDDAGERLDVALSRWLAEPRNRTAARIDRGEVAVDGRPAKRSLRLEGGERVTVEAPPVEPSGAAGAVAPPIRYEDDHVLVVAKPAGTVVHPGVGNPAGTLVQALVEAGVRLAASGGATRPGVVHRLDRGTSGLLVLAKTDEAHAGLVAALKRRDVTRGYLALAEGELPARTGRVDAPIGRDPRDRKRFAAIADGKPSVTHWRVRTVGRGGDSPVSLLDLRLETGRTHQIRVHLSYAGHPVVGDRTYGASTAVAERLGLERPYLHAARLSFDHPVTGDRIDLAEPLPEDLVAAAEAAGLTPADASPP